MRFFFGAAAKERRPVIRSIERYDSFEVDARNSWVEERSLRITQLGCLKFKTRCRIRGTPKTLHVKRCGKRWQAVIVCEIGAPKYKVALEKSICIDVGLTSLATLSDGSEIANPRWVKQFEKRLARMNRELSRKQRRSKNRARARQRLRRLHQRIAGRRQSYLHPITRALVERYDLLAFEKLNIRTMARSRLASPFLMPPGENSSGS